MKWSSNGEPRQRPGQLLSSARLPWYLGFLDLLPLHLLISRTRPTSIPLYPSCHAPFRD